MKHLLSALLAFALLAPMSSGEAQTEAAAATPAPTLQGHWVPAASIRSIESRRDAAVERVTDEMSIFARGIAGRRLRAGMPVPRQIIISGTGPSFRAKVGDYDLNFPADGSRHAMTDPFGEDINSSQGYRNGRLRQVMRADGGTLTHVLQLSEDGNTLTLTIRIGSPRLPADVVYRVRYRRR
ncbi:MAG: hypothetical protein AB8H86_30200 [Polyangiales bacterium]